MHISILVRMIRLIAGIQVDSLDFIILCFQFGRQKIFQRGREIEPCSTAGSCSSALENCPSQNCWSSFNVVVGDIADTSWLIIMRRSLGECTAVLRWDAGYRLRSNKDAMQHDGTGPRLALSGGAGEQMTDYVSGGGATSFGWEGCYTKAVSQKSVVKEQQNETYEVQREREGIVKKAEANRQKAETDDKEESNKKENGKTDGLEVNVTSNWSLVSPAKVGRSPATSAQNTVDIKISASKCSVLSMDEEEEGEILVEEQQNMEIEMDEENEYTKELESDMLKDNILNQQVREKDKAGLRKGMRRGQKTKA
ncbi:hypothetical protein F2Q70_00043238 [Brassica cretica]|uniref:Uncharacterized protein n=1 Tax=Brassica cretica TaxID=69181 RepID=A0A8S9KEV6_BRACR|nr:hypothetical protein F2Q70_00043238 [Brassica cretica]